MITKICWVKKTFIFSSVIFLLITINNISAIAITSPASNTLSITHIYFQPYTVSSTDIPKEVIPVNFSGMQMYIVTNFSLTKNYSFINIGAMYVIKNTTGNIISTFSWWTPAEYNTRYGNNGNVACELGFGLSASNKTVGDPMHISINLTAYTSSHTTNTLALANATYSTTWLANNSMNSIISASISDPGGLTDTYCGIYTGNTGSSGAGSFIGISFPSMNVVLVLFCCIMVLSIPILWTKKR